MCAASRMLALAFAGSVLAGCSRSAPDPAAASREITGTLALDGTPVTVTACRPGLAAMIYVEAVTPTGTLRFEDQQLSWNREPLTCAQLDRSWGGGTRADGSAYWRGTLVFRCQAGPRTVAGDLRLDCGNVTAEERQQLDAQRTELRSQQPDRASNPGADAGAAP